MSEKLRLQNIEKMMSQHTLEFTAEATNNQSNYISVIQNSEIFHSDRLTHHFDDDYP